MAGPFDARRHDAGGDDGGFEQAQIIAGKIKHFREVARFGCGPEVHAGEAKQRLLNDAQVGFHGRFRLAVATMHSEIDRDIQHARALGKVHAEEENVAPRTVGQVHPDRGPLAQDRIAAVPGLRRNSSGRRRSGWSAGCPMRNIHWLPRTERTLRRT